MTVARQLGRKNRQETRRMFEHVKVTGRSDGWIALPDGYIPGGTYERVAIGSKQALAMFKAANDIIRTLPRQPASDPTNLIVSYSPVLLDDRQIKREIDAISRDGG